MAHNHGAPPTTTSMDSNLNDIALVGNPNVGKSVVFGYLTGRYVIVSNYPGTTVEVSRGRLQGDRGSWEVIDTPGVNNFIPSSEDEVVTRNILMGKQPARILQVIDAKNLKRGLLLSLQLAEMGRPYVVCLNMSDEARDRGITFDIAQLSRTLGVPVIETIATQKVGLDQVTKLVVEEPAPPAPSAIDYPDKIRAALELVMPLLPQSGIAPQALALMVLTGDATLDKWLDEKVDSTTRELIRNIVERTRSEFSRSMTVEITQVRMRAAARIYAQVVHQRQTKLSTMRQWLGKASVHPIGGIAIVGAVLTAMYYFVGVFGAGTLVNYLESSIFGSYIIPWLTIAVETIVPTRLLQDLLVGEFGLLSMALSYSIAIVLPIVGTYFLAFGLLEDSGYLPRLSVMMNKVFNAMGLNGKAVLPMVLGLGCDTMATMTTRMLDSRKERIIVTLLLALAVPCSAQLGVILAMLQGISFSASMVWLMVVILTIFLVGYLAARVLPGHSSDFVLELPPLRRPLLGNILIKTLARLEWYLKEAVPLFFLGTFILFIMDRLALLTLTEQFAAPVVQGLLGLPAEATSAFIMGFLRRDYGAAGLFMLARDGQLDAIQIVVSLVVITLFMPCIANFFMIIKEQGLKIALAMAAFILPFALVVGGAVNWILRIFKVTF
ncbi:MAG: ferrous iron transport protein B [Candidatus Marinimicrobia bacterium]|nr:ferrous iron transport protein B [Candidatus Neomarinimicrobiota bacterium]